MTTKPIVTHEDFFHIYFEGYFQGNRVRIMKNKFSGAIVFNADDVCRCLDLGNSINDFLSTDKGLDFICDWKKENPDKPFIGEYGTDSPLQKFNTSDTPF